MRRYFLFDSSRARRRRLLVRRCLNFAVCFVLLVVAGSSKAEAGDYLRDVKPFLKERCYACHGALKQESGLRLDTGEMIRKGGDSGPAVEPGQPEASLIVERVSDADPLTRMPPDGEPLTAEQIALLRTWIESGGSSPADEQPESDPTRHWAFQPIVRPAVPLDESQPVRHPVDAFLAAGRERMGTSPSPPAAPQVLLRRVFIDLIGLPPDRDDLHAFLADPSDDAYTRLVDKLLADPRHGERWARHWMDVWRYSDWYGRRGVPDVLNSYGMIWRWRDWIVRSINEDRPYDEMIRMMLAADELDPADDADLVATGFLVRNFFRWNYDSWKKDSVEHVGKAFLGLTFNCAHCHDHKYDPITHEDYFAFRAFFEPLEIRQDRVPGERDPGVYPKYEYGKAYPPMTSGMVRVFDEQLDAKTYFYTGGEARNIVPDRPPIDPGVPEFLDDGSFDFEPIDLPVTVSHPGLKAFVRNDELAACQQDIELAAEVVAEGRRMIAAAEAAAADEAMRHDAEAMRIANRVEETNLILHQAKLVAVRAVIAADAARHGLTSADAEQMAQIAARAERLVVAERTAVEVAKARQNLAIIQTEAGSDPQLDLSAAEQRLTAAIAAAEAARAAVDAKSTTYTPLGPSYPTQSTGRRAALAHWITDRKNPLTARVTVNHVWRWHFGQPLVETTFDFGRNGKSPTHPELLDWLAVELMDSGWNLKHLHRLIVTSDAYRMRSDVAEHVAESRAVDPQNISYWRFPLNRLDAEAVRDGLLAVAGVLDAEMYGPDLEQAKGPTVPRRSLYFTHHGETRMAFLDLFDAADPSECYRRRTSIVPQQALALANNKMSVAAAAILEMRLWSQIADVPEADRRGEFVVVAFERILSRPPSPAERTLVAEFLERQASLPIEEAQNGAEPLDADTLARRGLIRALFNHNDFVTVR